MQRFKIYEDAENVKPGKKQKICENGRQALGEIKNIIVTRSKSSLELSSGFQKINLTKLKIKGTKEAQNVTHKSPKINNIRNNKPPVKTKSPIRNKQRRISSIFNVSDYINDIFDYLRTLEDKYQVKENPTIQDKFKEGTRLALLDWFVEIHEYFQMYEDTFQLSVSIMDRYLQKDETIQKGQLQLVALASAFVSSKYEEVFPIDVSDLMFVSDSAYTMQDIFHMETKILRALEFSFGRPVAAQFIRRYTIVTNATKVVESCAMYFSDTALLSYKLFYLKPSLLAATAFYIALCITNERIDPELWDSKLIQHSTYKFTQLDAYVPIMADVVIKSSTSRYEALKRKYAQSSHKSVSEMPALMPKTGIINKLIQ